MCLFADCIQVFFGKRELKIGQECTVKYAKNTKVGTASVTVTGKGNFENGIQIVIELAALIVPGIIVGIGYIAVGPTATYIFMCVLGLAFIVTYPWWIRNIYNRMMKRRYENIEGFLATKV